MGYRFPAFKYNHLLNWTIWKLTRQLKQNCGLRGGYLKRFNSLLAWNLENSNPNYYILTTSQRVEAGDRLSFGLTGTLSPVASSGVVTVSSTVLPTAVVEDRLTNNIDADKIEYFRQQIQVRPGFCFVSEYICRLGSFWADVPSSLCQPANLFRSF
ncbi:hypothetical protein [Spirosoma validum]|uniref:Uncharacterized protein n=1 Tax=Spirosoma validum TaxID=2771355 RepID=A0A927AZI6_9BACT|nr:hypothetical protein [Spirosoma validum]MBD2752517.1 hypothetical protein [Spirosoma validum]